MSETLTLDKIVSNALVGKYVQMIKTVDLTNVLLTVGPVWKVYFDSRTGIRLQIGENGKQEYMDLNWREDFQIYNSPKEVNNGRTFSD